MVDAARTIVSLVMMITGTAGVAPRTPDAGPDPAPQPESWTVDLAATDADRVDVAHVGTALVLDPLAGGSASIRTGHRDGAFTAAPHALATPANRITADLRADVPPGTAVLLDLRGHLDDGWTEWIPAEGHLVSFDRPVERVQARLVLSAPPAGARPAVSALALTADLTTVTPAAVTAAVSSRVFATREGMVGGTTANGHVIVPRDHFAALPSRRGLSPRNTGDYTVRVCAPSGRCEYAPVWDVGPWNSRDDYWNPGTVRQMWKDLPQGTPEAWAAYQDGYNGGRDQFNRRVANPAGIDLADGTFWDGLLLTTNNWVTVTYLWTGAAPRGSVQTGGGTLDVRSGPGTGFPVVGLAANRATVPIECTVAGEEMAGPHRTTTQWHRLGAGHYVSHGYIADVNGGTPPACA